MIVATPPEEQPAFSIAMVMYHHMDPLDLVGPFEVLSRLPNAKLSMVAATNEAVTASPTLPMLPSHGFADIPAADILFVPGGPGHRDMLHDEAMLSFLRRVGSTATFVSSVCTGSLLLGAAGLLDGYECTSHWMCLEELTAYGARPVSRRVVVDRNRITGAGVSAGIDLALVIAAMLCGEEVARRIQLLIEYDPDPPFNAGSPSKAEPELVREMRAGYLKSRQP